MPLRPPAVSAGFDPGVVRREKTRQSQPKRRFNGADYRAQLRHSYHIQTPSTREVSIGPRGEAMLRYNINIMTPAPPSL
jgi:hypothetical protein